MSLPEVYVFGGDVGSFLIFGISLVIIFGQWLETSLDRGIETFSGFMGLRMRAIESLFGNLLGMLSLV